MSTAGYFVTGTDTGVGKTQVSAALLHALCAHGMRAVGMKPVAAGCEWRNGEAYWDDVEQLRAASNVDAPMAHINPYRFEPPIAPHIAAAQIGVTIHLETLVAAFQALQAQAEMVVVEGAGGFRVPLNDNEDTADFARQLALPVILVVGMRLGCINHALLTMQAIALAGVSLAGWVANRTDPDMAEFNANLKSLSARIDAPLLGVVPHFSQPTAADVAANLNLGILLNKQIRIA